MKGKKLVRLTLAAALALCLCFGFSRAVVVRADDAKSLTVDASVTDNTEGETYITIQAALDYIAAQEDTSGWSITVKSGDYTYFTVDQTISNLTIKGESGATVDCSSGSIQLMGDTITLDGLTFTAADTAWGVPIIKDASSNAGIFYDSMVTIKNCTFQGSNAGCALWICRLNSTVQNCTFDGFSYAFEIINETSTAAKIDTETTTGTITIDGNTVTNCDFFIHYGVRSGITFVVTNNTVKGSEGEVCASLFAWDGESITVSGNTFTYAAFGLQNATDGTSAESFLSTNTFNSSYVADDYYDYSTGSDYSVTYYLPEKEGVIYKWSVSESGVSGTMAENVAEALEGNEYDSPLTFTTTGGKGDLVCMGLAYQALIVEEIPTGSINVEKTVEGGDTTATFDFTVTIDTDAEACKAQGYDLTGTYGSVTLSSGTGTFSLSNGGSVTISGIPEGAAYEITETAVDGYTTTVSNNVGNIVGGSTITVSYTNTYEEEEEPIPDPEPTEPTETTDFDISKSKEATNLDENYESQVTLSLPSASYSGDLDVVFVLDGSTSHDNTNLAAQAAAMLDELVAYENLNIKVGVVVFGGYNPILESTGLLSLKGNLEDLKTFLTTDYKSLDGRSGSNLQAGVEKARELLNADTEVDGSDKYMIILTDGGARMWYDSESGEAMSDAYAYGSSVWWNSNEDWCNRYGVTGSESYVSETAPSFMDVWNAGQSGIDIGAYGLTYSDWQSAVAGDSSVSYASWDTAMHADDYYTTYEAACYYAATSIVEASQEVNVCMVTYEYYADTTYTTFTEEFKTFLEDYVTRYNINQIEDIDEETAAAVFADVKDELIQLVDAGSAVVDEIGETSDYAFDFVNDIAKLTLTVDGVSYEVTQLSDTSYGFGDANGSKDGATYPFVLTYYPDGTTYEGTAYNECFVLEINVPITKNDQVQLTYSVVLTNPQTTAGTYGVYDQYGDNNDGTTASASLYTNNVATLYPVDSNGNYGEPEDFQKPTVSYTVTAEPEPETPGTTTEDPEPTEETTETTEETTVETTTDPVTTTSAETGDNSNLEVFIALIAVCVVALIALITVEARKRSR